MFESFRRSWQLVKASWAVLQSDKELILFPILSGVTMLIVSIVFLLPAAVLLGMLGIDSNGGGDIIGYVVLFFYYLISYTIVIFFNTALIGAALIRLDGGDPTVADGLRIAREKFRVIVGYAAISATVGLVLRFLQERGGIFGDIVAFLGGVTWNIVTFLVIPVLVTRDVGPIDAVKGSASLLKETWGDQITGNFSLGGVFFLLFFAVIGGGILLIALVASLFTSPAPVIIMVVLLMIAIVVLSVISSALGAIFQAALFRYAEEGVAPTNYDIETIRGAFKPKRKN